MSFDHLVFIAMVFIAVFLLATSVIVPSVGSNARVARRLRARVHDALEAAGPENVSLLRENSFRKRSPLEQRIDQLPGMDRLAALIEQAGRTETTFRLVTLMTIIAATTFMLVVLVTRDGLAGLLFATLAAWSPVLKLQIERRRRLARFEEQLPEALDVMARALRTGHPFNETLKFVSEEMVDPVRREFGITFADINYGVNMKDAFHAMLARVPSVSLMAVITAVLVQRESGGNLAEILDKIAAVVRGRFRFQRRVRTLSAEGRLSAWILSLIPFVLAGVVSVSSPTYLPLLIKDPTGRTLVAIAFVMITTGIWWIRRIIRIQV